MGRILSFNEDNHEYQVNGEVIPSVSEIIRFISREVYGDVVQSVLDTAADRGTRVHKATQMLDVVHDVECDDDIVPYVQAYVQFLRDHKPTWDAIEKSFYNPEKMYAGTVDRIGTFDEKKTLVDIKTSSSLQKILYGAQLNLYRMGLAANGIDVERLVILHLTKEKGYKIVEIPVDDEVANACLTLHNALKKKPRKKKGE
nr:MAG TPA: exonuclease [Bacteriophage sp.]